MAIEVCEQNVSGIFHELLGVRPLQIQSIAEGVMTHKFLVTMPESAYIIRFYPEGREKIVEFEPDVIGQCGEAGIKVPRVLTDSRTGPSSTSAYMIYEYIKGQTLASQLGGLNSDQLMGVCRELVEAMDKMGMIKNTGYGEIVAKNQATSHSWQEFVHNAFRSALSHRSMTKLCTATELDKLTQLSKEIDEVLVEAEPSLVYSDLRPENIILTPSQNLAAMVDFEGVLSGDSLLSLGFCYASSGDNLFFAAMQQSWIERHGTINTVLIDVYALLRIMRIVEHMGKPLPAGGKRDPIDKSFPGFFKSLERIKLNNTF